MSDAPLTVVAEAPEPVPAAPAVSPRTSLRGIRTVAEHEFRVRLRTGRWRWMLAAWFVVLCVFTLLLDRAVGESYSHDEVVRGVPVFGGLMLALLGLSLLVVPALTAQSVNGDRERGVLATLQVTLLTPAEIALGKLAAAWAVSLVFLLAAIPMVAATMAMGGVGLGQVLPTMLVLAVLLGVVAAIAQCLSALVARTVTSAVLSYVAVFGLSAGTLVTFALALPLTTETATITYAVPTPEAGPGAPPYEPAPVEAYTEERTRADKVWWLLGANPFVILADAAPAAPPRYDPRTHQRLDDALDPLAEIRTSVRDARTPPDDEIGDRSITFDSFGNEIGVDEPGPVWPYGLAFDAVLGAGAVLLTIRRLRTPVAEPPRGIRIA